MEEYQYQETLGEGAYGFVWKCVERATGRLVAIKGFKQAHVEPEIMRLALREVRVLQTLRHPAIVPLINVFRSHSGRVYMVFPYVGPSAFQEIDARQDGLSPPRLKLLVWQLLQAVVYLHRRRIVHRDIKPGNILLSEAGEVKLCDFGFARPTQCGPREAEDMTRYVFTRWYRAPEVLVGEPYGPSADIWSLGCTLAELASGQPLFPGKSTGEQLWRIMRCCGPLLGAQAARLTTAPHLHRVRVPVRGRSLRERLRGCDPDLIGLVEACLQPDPRDRPTAAGLVRSSYLRGVPKLLAGTPLDRVYGGMLQAQQERRQQQHGGQDSQRQQLEPEQRSLRQAQRRQQQEPPARLRSAVRSMDPLASSPLADVNPPMAAEGPQRNASDCDYVGLVRPPTADVAAAAVKPPSPPLGAPRPLALEDALQNAGMQHQHQRPQQQQQQPQQRGQVLLEPGRGNVAAAEAEAVAGEPDGSLPPSPQRRLATPFTRWPTAGAAQELPSLRRCSSARVRSAALAGAAEWPTPPSAAEGGGRGESPPSGAAPLEVYWSTHSTPGSRGRLPEAAAAGCGWEDPPTSIGQSDLMTPEGVGAHGGIALLSLPHDLRVPQQPHPPPLSPPRCVPTCIEPSVRTTTEPAAVARRLLRTTTQTSVGSSGDGGDGGGGAMGRCNTAQVLEGCAAKPSADLGGQRTRTGPLAPNPCYFGGGGSVATVRRATPPAPDNVLLQSDLPGTASCYDSSAGVAPTAVPGWSEDLPSPTRGAPSGASSAYDEEGSLSCASLEALLGCANGMLQLSGAEDGEGEERGSTDTDSGSSDNSSNGTDAVVVPWPAVAAAPGDVTAAGFVEADAVAQAGRMAQVAAPQAVLSPPSVLHRSASLLLPPLRHHQWRQPPQQQQPPSQRQSLPTDKQHACLMFASADIEYIQVYATGADGGGGRGTGGGSQPHLQPISQIARSKVPMLPSASDRGLLAAAVPRVVQLPQPRGPGPVSSHVPLPTSSGGAGCNSEAVPVALTAPTPARDCRQQKRGSSSASSFTSIAGGAPLPPRVPVLPASMSACATDGTSSSFAPLSSAASRRNGGPGVGYDSGSSGVMQAWVATATETTPSAVSAVTYSSAVTAAAKTAATAAVAAATVGVTPAAEAETAAAAGSPSLLMKEELPPLLPVPGIGAGAVPAAAAAAQRGVGRITTEPPLLLRILSGWAASVRTASSSSMSLGSPPLRLAARSSSLRWQMASPAAAGGTAAAATSAAPAAGSGAVAAVADDARVERSVGSWTGSTTHVGRRVFARTAQSGSMTWVVSSADDCGGDGGAAAAEAPAASGVRQRESAAKETGTMGKLFKVIKKAFSVKA